MTDRNTGYFSQSNGALMSALGRALNAHTPLRQTVKLQQAIYARALDPKVTDAALAKFARAYRELEELKRIIRRQGKPKDVPAANDTSAQSHKRRLPVAPVTLPPDAA